VVVHVFVVVGFLYCNNFPGNNPLGLRRLPMPNSPAEQLEAVFLFQEEQISRELLYPEFEAILDGFIPVPDFANASAKAVYVQIDHSLCVTGAVFFFVGF
jgi:hypothetical protein